MMQCKELTSKQFSLEIGLVKQIDKIYYEILKKTTEVKPQNIQQKANYALAIRNYRLFHCAVDLLEDGCYEASMTLLRSAYENLLQMNYFAVYDKEAEQWLTKGKKIEQRDIRKKLNISPSLYNMLSVNYAHSLTVESLEPLVFEAKDGKLSLNHYPAYSASECMLGLFFWISFAHQTIQQMQIVFKAAQITDKAWMRKVVEIQRLVTQYLEEMKLDFKKEQKRRGLATEV